MSTQLPVLTPADFASDQDVRWCPGCGDYSILAQMKKMMPTLGMPREKIVFVSGIGCSSRFPYYMNTYGIHSIHGRAPAIATGFEAVRPDLQVWVITGDGDGLSIGGNHLMHAIRRNLDINIILFNNRIYGLTKGQYFADVAAGQGDQEHAVRQRSTIRSIRCRSRSAARRRSWRARSTSTSSTWAYVLKRAAEHKGTAFVEVYQNCIVFNDARVRVCHRAATPRPTP